LNTPVWTRIAWKPKTWGAGLVLAVALAGTAWAQEPAAGAAPERAPEIRLIEPGHDDPALARMAVMRQKLPEKFRRRRHNFAWAVAKIDGLDKVEYFAHSGIKRKGDVTAAPPEDVDSISFQRKTGRFEVLCVNRDDVVEGPDCFPRYADTELKIIEDMASRLPDPAVTGRVRIYTDLYPCASCRHVMAQFLAIYTNVQMQVLYRER
jgi:hypothetical protein